MIFIHFYLTRAHKMNIQLSTELFFLTLTAGLTGVIWIPYILNRIVELGLWPALQNGNPDEAPKAFWAHRMMSAHRNAIENLVIFTPLVLILDSLNISNTITVMAATMFFITRALHLVIYTLGIPVLRTIAFAIGFACQLALFVQIVA
jgi:uncharacterized MAPEG superfamily protein